MNHMEYTVSRRTVKFRCRACRNMVKADLDDAGNTEHCPHCRALFTVPGEAELQRERAAAIEKERLNDEKDEERRRERAAVKEVGQQKDMRYVAASTLAGILDVVGLLAITIGAMVIVGALAMLIEVGTRGLPTLIGGIGSAFTGCLIAGMGQALKLLRDIAINTEKNRSSHPPL